MGTTEGHAEGARPAWTSRPPFPPTKTNGVLPGTDNASQPTRFPPLSRPYFLSAPEASDFPSALEPPPIPVLPSELDGNIAGSSLDPAFVQHKKRPAKSAHSRQISYGWQVCLRLWASPTLVCKRIICQLRSWLAEPYAESTELITRQLLRQRTDGYARIVKMGFAVFGLLFAMAVHRRGLQWTTGLILGIAWFWTCVAVAPPGPHGDWRLRLWRPQVISILLIFLYSLLTKHVRTPTPPGFSFEPICMAFVDFAVQLVLAKRDFMLLDRFLTGFLIIAIHVVASPIVSLGWRQQVLSVGANTLGFSFGIAIRTDEQQLRAMIEEVETEHRAMLRLHHVIQGQCEGAAALVRAIRETEGEKGVSEATSSLISDIEGMLDEAASWCRSRAVFQKLDAGTYVSQMRRVPLHEMLSSLVGAMGAVEAPGYVVADPTLVQLLVREGLANAALHSNPGTPIKIEAELLNEVRPTGVSHQLHISVTNINRGGVAHLSRGDCERVFRRKERAALCANLTRSDGTGLAGARQAAKFVGGDVWLEANRLRTEFHLLLPASPSHLPPAVSSS